MPAASVLERRATHAVQPLTKGPGRRALRRGLVAGMAAGAVFVILQALLAAYNLHILREAIARRVVRGAEPVCLGHCLWQAFPEAILTYAGFALAGVMVAAAGHRLLSALPASMFVLFNAIHGISALQPIGQQWQVQCFDRCPGVWFGNPWVGASTDLLLVLIPAVVVAWSVHPHRWPGPLDPSIAASVGVAVGLVLLTYHTTAVIDGRPDIRVTWVVAVFALAAGARRPWWPWAHVVSAAALSGYFGYLWLAIIAPEPYGSISLAQAVVFAAESLAPILVIAVLGSSWTLTAAALHKGIERPLALLAVVNVLNLADALLTRFAVGSGGALELNPFVRAMGLPVKLVVVAALTVLLYKRRAPALVWPVAVLLWVLCYHISGIVVNG